MSSWMVATLELRAFRAGRSRFARPLGPRVMSRVYAAGFLGAILKFLGAFCAAAWLGAAFHNHLLVFRSTGSSARRTAHPSFAASPTTRPFRPRDAHRFSARWSANARTTYALAFPNIAGHRSDDGSEFPNRDLATSHH